jgi:hypothetical protein
MADVICGISVLQRTKHENVFRLWIRCCRCDGHSAQTCIFVSDHLLPKHEPIDGDQVWQFERDGCHLNCHPSVNWISWGFHNDYKWRTQFVEMREPEWPYDALHDQPREHRGSAIHYDLNNSNLTWEQRAKMFEELREVSIC